MDPTLSAALMGALAAVAVGLAAWLAYTLSAREQASDIAKSTVLPEGVDSVLSVLRSSVVVLDRDLRVLKASPAAYTFGVVHRDALAVGELAELAVATFRDGEIRQADLAIRRGRYGDTVLYVSARVAPLGSDLVLVFVDDRTQAQRMDEVRRDFVANVSHELKTPVGALYLLSEAVQDASDDPEAVVRFAHRMQAESARLTRLVQEIIDLSRLQYDDPIDSARPVSVDEVMAESLDRARVDAEARHIRLTYGGHSGLYVLGDRSQLVTAVGNLVENAVAYSPDNTGVAVGARLLDDIIEISVTDQGVGIPDADLDRIFERFYRVDPARSRKTGGTGLGLSIVKHVAAAHGGDVAVWSVAGTGSTFTLRLPELAMDGDGLPTVPGVASTTSMRVADSSVRTELIEPPHSDLPPAQPTQSRTPPHSSLSTTPPSGSGPNTPTASAPNQEATP